MLMFHEQKLNVLTTWRTTKTSTPVQKRLTLKFFPSHSKASLWLQPTGSQTLNSNVSNLVISSILTIIPPSAGALGMGQLFTNGEMALSSYTRTLALVRLEPGNTLPLKARYSFMFLNIFHFY